MVVEVPLCPSYYNRVLIIQIVTDSWVLARLMQSIMQLFLCSLKSAWNLRAARIVT